MDSKVGNTGYGMEADLLPTKKDIFPQAHGYFAFCCTFAGPTLKL
jgi:hypothetical protein